MRSIETMIIPSSAFQSADVKTGNSSAIRVPLCHFTPMQYASADDWPNGQVEFWECQHCGHTKEAGRVAA